jgi:hypothetical protein
MRGEEISAKLAKLESNLEIEKSDLQSGGGLMAYFVEKHLTRFWEHKEFITKILKMIDGKQKNVLGQVANLI